MAFVIIVFTIWRIATIGISFLSPHFISYLGNFPYKELLLEYRLPLWLSSFANFDGIHYTIISQSGYYQNDQAFFPLYPLLIRVFSFLFPIRNSFFAPYNYLLVGFILSTIFFLSGLLLFYFYLQALKLTKKAVWVLLFIILFPSAFFFGAVYTEGLFFFLTSLFLFSLQKKQYILVFVAGALASATRLVGVFLFFPLLFHLIQQKKIHQNIINTKQYILVLMSPFLGLFAYSTYLFFKYQDPFFFITAQKAFNANRSTHVILLPQVYFRYAKILFTASHTFQWYLSLFELVVFSVVLGVLVYNCVNLIRHHGSHAYSSPLLGLNVFSLANLILPTLTGTFSSIPRYVLFSLSFFITLSTIENRLIKIAILAVFGIGQIVLLAFFTQGYFVG